MLKGVSAHQANPPTARKKGREWRLGGGGGTKKRTVREGGDHVPKSALKTGLVPSYLFSAPAIDNPRPGQQENRSLANLGKDIQDKSESKPYLP